MRALSAVEKMPGIISIVIIALIRHMLPMFMQGESDAPASPVAGSLQVIYLFTRVDEVLHRLECFPSI